MMATMPESSFRTPRLAALAVAASAAFFAAAAPTVALATPAASAPAATVADASGAKILLVQETEGTITALSSVCTHQGCTVQPGNGELDCPCHGSKFDLSGTPTSGPAKEPLPTVAVHVDGDAVFSGA